jgi:hypothetical protein
LTELISNCNKFDTFLNEAIDEAFSSLGEKPKAAIYFHLEKVYSIHKDEIPKRINAFGAAIEALFGIGARCLEIQIMLNLYAKVSTLLKEEFLKLHNLQELSFSQYLELIESQFKNTVISESNSEQGREVQPQ